MTDYSFLKVFNSELDRNLTAYDIIRLTDLSIQVVDIKLDSLINKGLIEVHRLEEFYKGESFSVSKRWLDENERCSEYNNLLISTYSLTNAGLQYFEEERFIKESLSKRTKREWINITISFLSIVIAIIALIKSLS